MPLLLGGACWLMLAGGAEPPEAKPTVVLMPLSVEGSLGDAARLQLEQAVTSGLAKGKFEVVAAPAGSAESCSEPECFRERGAALDASYLLRVVVVAGDDRNYQNTLSLIDGSTGVAVAESSEFCEVCGQEELRALMEDQGSGMRRKLDDLVDGPPVLMANSTPSGALVSIDGELVGRTPMSRELTAGEHIARVELEGHVAEERTFLAVGGVEETLSFDLAPIPKRRANLSPWGWAGLGVGVATLAAGATFLVLDERSAPGDRCAGDNVDAGGDCRFRYNTLTPGIALTVTGAVVATAAIAVLIHVARRSRRSRKAAALRWGGRALAGIPR